MYTSSHIRRHIFSLTDGAIFSTREFLHFGKRSAVHKCLSRLVKRGEIIRLAHGLFKKFDGNPPPIPYVVAAHKAKAFGKQIVMHADKENKKADGNIQTISFVYSINSHSSKFRYGKKIIYFLDLSR